jgi:uncharacterized DUF497 family protein
MVGRNVELTLRGFEWDQFNARHFARHGVTYEQILAVKDNAPRFFENLDERAASHIMVGPNFEGRYFYIAIVEVPHNLWRPITGWPLGRRWRRYYDSGGAE